MQCELLWEECNCEDCNRAKELYEELEYLEQSIYTEFMEDRYAIIKELEDMGYST